MTPYNAVLIGGPDCGSVVPVEDESNLAGGKIASSISYSDSIYNFWKVSEDGRYVYTHQWLDMDELTDFLDEDV